MDLKQKYADKIAKLLAKAESTTPEEAEMLTAKAQELMASYAIDEALVEAARKFSGESAQVVEEEFVFIGIYRFPLADLGNRVLMVNDCKVVQLGGKNWREIEGKVYKETIVYRAVGFKGDLDRARFLITSLQLQAMRAENQWWDKHKELYRHEKKGGHYSRRQFLFSYGYAVHEKLKKAAARARVKAEADKTTGTSVALVLADKSALVVRKFNELHPNLRKSHSRYSGGDAFAGAAGYEAGKSADIGQDRMGGRNKLGR